MQDTLLYTCRCVMQDTRTRTTYLGHARQEFQKEWERERGTSEPKAGVGGVFEAFRPQFLRAVETVAVERLSIPPQYAICLLRQHLVNLTV